MYYKQERKLLQLAVSLACIVPLLAGCLGMVQGSQFMHESNMEMDSHFRYLSGLLLGIGLGFSTTVTRIEHYKARFKLLTCIVVIGGLGRLLGVFMEGIPDISMQFALVMELVVTPVLCLWQHRIADKCV